MATMDPQTLNPLGGPAAVYVRHRDRMVQESVFEDLQNTLIACRWLAGTTSRPVVSPYDPSTPDHPRSYRIVTTAPEETLRLLGTKGGNGTGNGTPAQIVLIDYFPEAGGNDDEKRGASRKTEPNTLAVDTGVPQESVPIELGSNMEEKPYVFTIAFYATSDAVALAVMNDLRDRYAGRLVTDDHLDLYNFNDPAYSNRSRDRPGR